jgi:hypothetical protein
MKQSKNRESGRTENKANARAVFEQYWLQARHIENERLQLTYVFTIIFASLLGLITVQGLEWYIPAFGILLSITGILSMHSLRIWFIRFSRLAENIMINELGAGEYSPKRFSNTEGKLNLFIRRLWALPFALIFFYSAMLALWSTLLLKAFGLSSWLWTVFVGIICSSFIFYWCVLFPREKKAENEVIDKNK